MKEAWEGPARLHLIPHVNARTADLPVRRVLGGKHIKAYVTPPAIFILQLNCDASDLTLPHGYVLHDYHKEAALVCQSMNNRSYRLISEGTNLQRRSVIGSACPESCLHAVHCAQLSGLPKALLPLMVEMSR